MKRIFFIIACLLAAYLLTGCLEITVNTDSSSSPVASAENPAVSAAAATATNKPSTAPAATPSAATGTPSASGSAADEEEPAPGEGMQPSPSNSVDIYSSFAHMVSFDPARGWAEFDYFDILRGEDAVEWLVNEEGYTLSDAREEVSNYADSEFIEKNTNPQLRTIDLKETALQLVIGPDGTLNEGAEPREVEIGEYFALYERDPSLLLDLYFYYIEAEGSKAVSVGQVYWP